MIKKLSLLSLLAVCLQSAASAQQSTPPVSLRVIVHDPVNPMPELFLPDKSGNVVALEVMPRGISHVQFTLPTNGSLVLYNQLDVDPKNPSASLAASAKLPANVRQLIAIVTPAPPKSKVPYRMVLINDSKRGFPAGESRILSLLPMDVAIEAGEHKIPVKSGVITRLAPVKKVSEYNMAQTNFYYKEGKSWVPFTERQLKYLDEFRRVFVIYVTPGSKQPSVSTILDTPAAAPPKDVSDS